MNWGLSMLPYFCICLFEAGCAGLCRQGSPGYSYYLDRNNHGVRPVRLGYNQTSLADDLKGNVRLLSAVDYPYLPDNIFKPVHYRVDLFRNRINIGCVLFFTLRQSSRMWPLCSR